MARLGTPEAQHIMAQFTLPAGVMNIRENGIVIAQAVADYYNGEVTLENLAAVCGRPDVQAKLKWHAGHEPERRKQVWDSWWKERAPKDLLQTPENGQKIITQLYNCYGSEVTYPNLDRAFEDVRAMLDFVKPPTQAEREAEAVKKAQDLEAADLVRRLKEAAENDENAFLEKRKQQAEAQDKAKKETDKNEIYRQNVDSLIATVEIYAGPNRLSHAKTEAFRAKLRQVRVYKNGQVDWFLTLKAVKEIVMNTDSDGSSMLREGHGVL
jgi:hypothetical protein